MLDNFRRSFVAGLILLTPLAATIYVLNLLVSGIGGRFRNVFFFFMRDTVSSRAELVVFWNVLATLLVLVIVTALGFLSRYLFTRLVVGTAERLIQRLPFISTVYGTVKQIVDTFSLEQRAVFQQAVLVEFPRKGVYVLGFQTNTAKGEPQDKTAAELWNIFVPTTPNPTSGFLLMVPKEEIIPLEMSISDGMKVIMSGGAVVPKYDEGSSAKNPSVAVSAKAPFPEPNAS